YSLAEVALVTPMRDGMNLVAKEYVASKVDKRGVLILSERAGAARELSDAIIINPTDMGQLAEAMHEALVMPEDEQITRMTAMQALVKRYNVFSWTKLFMNQLAYTKMKQHTLATEMLTPTVTTQLLADYHAAKQRLLLLDYDGTLVGFHANPQRAEPDQELRHLLRALAEQPNTRVVIISGRDRTTLDKWLGDLPIDFITEHGVWLRAAGQEWELFQALRNDWMRDLRPVLELYVARTAGSFIEEKDFSLVWHYRRADADLGEVRARELLAHLSFMTANTDLQVMEGNKVLEIKNAGIHKGAAAARWLAAYPADFMLALGDDRTDEDTFRAMPPEAYTVRVGTGARSLARFNIGSPIEVRQLLRKLLA
ncbi:MAG: trehalose-phosphatase, partial [Hymenobacter sp.]